ncbi:MAG TPA: hypothetical protein VJN96_09910 [Vicinamibacterales bacterium]|nr:hypothetical protein [Vicinamibacterales bacterium]
MVGRDLEGSAREFWRRLDRRWWTWLFAACGLLILLLFALPSLVNPCGNEKLAEYPSPDGKLKVIVFERDCGATTSFSTQASIVPTRAGMPGGSGNLFIADADHGSAPPGDGGGPELRVRWIDEQTVELAHHALARVFKSEPTLGGVRATFTTFR